MPVRKAPSLQTDNKGPELLERLKFALARGTELPTHAVNYIDRLLQEDPTSAHLSRIEPITETMMKEKGYSSEQLQPQSFIENIGQRFLEKTPLAAISGPQALISSAVGSTAGAGAEQLGVSPGGQTAIDLMADLFTGRQLRKIPTIGKPRHVESGGLDKIYKDQQAITESSAKTGVQGSIITPFLEKPRKLLSKIYDKGSNATRRDLLEIDRILENAADIHGNSDFMEALKIRREIDSLIPTATNSAKHVLMKTRSGINDFLKRFNPANPEFAKSLTKEDQIYTLQQMAKSAEDYAKNWATGVYASKIGKPLLKTFAKGAEIISHSAVLLNNDPKLFGKYVYNAAQAAAKNNKSAFINAITRLEKINNREERKSPDIKKGKVYKVQNQ